MQNHIIINIIGVQKEQNVQMWTMFKVKPGARFHSNAHPKIENSLRGTEKRTGCLETKSEI